MKQPEITEITEITASNANFVFQKLLGYPSQCIDLSKIQHCDSAGIAVLIEVKRQKIKKQQTVSYIKPSKQLLELSSFFNVSSLLFDE